MTATEKLDLSAVDPRIEQYRRLRSRGMPKPADAPKELWEAAGPYQPMSINQAQAALMSRLADKVIESATQEIPDGKGLVEALYAQAVAVHAEVMCNPEAKDSDKLSAAGRVIEYKVGKPTQTIEHSGTLSLTVHKELEQMAKQIKRGEIVDVYNLLDKPRTAVDTFLEKHMPVKHVVGRKVAAIVEQEQEPGEGLPQGTGCEA